MPLFLSQMSSGWRETANWVILAPDVGRLQIALVPLSGADQGAKLDFSKRYRRDPNTRPPARAEMEI